MSEFDAVAWTFEGCHGLEGFESAHARAIADRGPFTLPGDVPVWGRDRPFSVEHLRLELAIDPRRRSVRGIATTTIHPRHDGLREAVFDAIELQVESVT